MDLRQRHVDKDTIIEIGNKFYEDIQSAKKKKFEIKKYGTFAKLKKESQLMRAGCLAYVRSGGNKKLCVALCVAKKAKNRWNQIGRAHV